MTRGSRWKKIDETIKEKYELKQSLSNNFFVQQILDISALRLLLIQRLSFVSVTPNGAIFMVIHVNYLIVEFHDFLHITEIFLVCCFHHASLLSTESDLTF